MNMNATFRFGVVRKDENTKGDDMNYQDVRYMNPNHTKISMLIPFENGYTVIEVTNHHHARGNDSCAYDIEIDENETIVFQSDYYDWEIEWAEALELNPLPFTKKGNS